MAIGTFLLSTLLFISYIISNGSAMVLVIAWPFALGAILVNAIMFIHLTDRFVHLPEHRRDIAVKLLILLSNIPIFFFYYVVVMKS